MSSIRDIRKKIGSVANTRKITSAMEKVAASKMRRSQERMLSARPYAQAIEEIMHHVSDATPEYVPLLMRRRDGNRRIYIVVSSDKGLCGGLNLNLFKNILLQVRADDVRLEHVRICSLGSKGTHYFRQLGFPVLQSVPGVGEHPEAEGVAQAVRAVTGTYERAETDAVYLCYNRFVNTMTQTPVLQALLPLSPELARESEERVHAEGHWDYLYEPEAPAIVDLLLARYVESVVYRAVCENFACEQAAKMLAMKNATDNADELIGDLQLLYNNARQAAITKELSEIIGGAEAV